VSFTTRSLEVAIETINPAIALFRSKQPPVIAVQHMDAEDQPVPGAAAVILTGFCAERGGTPVRAPMGKSR
jgi:hypothetical protein